MNMVLSSETSKRFGRPADRLKIALVAHLRYPISEPFFGGLEMHTHLLARKLEERGHLVTMFAAEGSDFAKTAMMCAPLRDHSRNSPVLADIEDNAYRRVVEALRGGDFDVIHNNALHALLFECSHELSTPLAGVMHTGPIQPLADTMRSVSDAVACVSVSASLAASWPRMKRGPIIIHNGIDLGQFPFRTCAGGPPCCVWFGRVTPEKGPHLAIDAARMAGIPIKLAGPRNDEAYWQDFIEPRLGGDVAYIGHLCQTELAAAVGASSVAVCSTCEEEPFGLVVAQALACGTPVAGFSRGALPEILDPTCGALAQAGDVAGLADAIRKCLGLNRRDCRDRAENHFDIELMIDRYEEVYRWIIARKLMGVADLGAKVFLDAERLPV